MMIPGPPPEATRRAQKKGQVDAVGGDAAASPRGPGGAALGNNGVTATQQVTGLHARRRDRWNLSARLWEMSGLPAVRRCRKHLRFGNDEGVEVRRNSESAGFGGLMTCGSPWACPRCAAMVAVTRAEEIARAVQHVNNTGGQVVFLTFTMRHDRSHSLADEWKALSAGWRAVFGGPAWVGRPARRNRAAQPGERDLRGVLGTVRTVEATHGQNGWHLHVHALVFASAGAFADDDDLQSFGDRLHERWSRGVQNAGLPAPTRKHGTDVRLVEDGGAAFVGSYLNKTVSDSSMKAGLEAAAGGLKKGRKSNRAPFQILRDALEAEDHATRYRWYARRDWEPVTLADGTRAMVVNDRDSDDFGTVYPIDEKTGLAHKPPSRDFELWHEWEKVSKGKRQIVWSQRFAKPKTDREVAWNAVLDARGEEIDDDDIAAQALEGKTVAIIEHLDWMRRMCSKPSLIYGLLEALEEAPPDQAAMVACGYGELHGLSIYPAGSPPGSSP